MCDELAEKFEKMTKLINGHNEWELERPESTTPRVRPISVIMHNDPVIQAFRLFILKRLLNGIMDTRQNPTRVRRHLQILVIFPAPTRTTRRYVKAASNLLDGTFQISDHAQEVHTLEHPLAPTHKESIVEKVIEFR